ncbi:MAG: ATP-binding protein [Gammaproteobacteria bacterium]|nr:ATP-binding protein [Gammaproteobacteria bacterium]
MSPKPRTPNFRREYSQWIANQTLEDYSLRYTAKRARRWSNARVANTALGIVSFLALEAIGGTITLNYGFINAFWAIMVVGLIIFLCGLPISYYAAKYGVDIDLLTRGTGFGYIGSTISSLIYASFTFIFFAIEAAIMSMAIHMATDIPLSIAYVISALVVIPLVTHGISRISTFQAWTQPLWILLQLLPLFYVASNQSGVFQQWMNFEGVKQAANEGLSLYLFGACAAVIFPLIAQNGEQADFLRFLPVNKERRLSWWMAVISAGPGWVIVGVAKLLLGSFLAVLALNYGLSLSEAADPAHMYAVVFEYLTQNPQTAIYVAAVFVVISQLKINVTNAYAGSIAWGNFFSRLTHHHPGRVVWLFFNVAIALLLMELGLYQAFEEILVTYSILVVAWIGCVVADLVVNKPLGLSPRHIEFRRSHLYDINPVGVGSMIIASATGFGASLGLLGDTFKVMAPFIALGLPFITVPLIAWLTQSRFYLNNVSDLECSAENLVSCVVCENAFDVEDMSACPSYNGAICSLCCSLDARCGDRCRPQAHFAAQTSSFLGRILPPHLNQKLHSTTSQFFVIFSVTGVVIAALLSLVYYAQADASLRDLLLIESTLWRVFFLLLVVAGVLVWLYVLAQRSARLALTELESQAQLLEDEVDAHEETNRKLLDAKNAADTANQAKSRYLSGVSHELRTPLNTIFGYAQLMETNEDLDAKTRNVATIIRRSGQHLSDVVESLLDFSKIEARRLEIHRERVAITKLISQLDEMFSQQARAKGITFKVHNIECLPSYVNADEKRLRQILLNLLSNALKYTEHGSVDLIVSYRNQVATFLVRDTGVGIPREDLTRIFEPFERVKSKTTSKVSGTGLGLTISRLLAELMGGQILVSSEEGKGSEFSIQLMLPGVTGVYRKHNQVTKIRKLDVERTLLLVDDEEAHRNVIKDLLAPARFRIVEADCTEAALKKAEQEHIDLYLLDINLPDASGWTLLQSLRNKHVTQPVIMLSADPYEADAVNQMRDKFDAYINKPVVFEKLIEQLEKALKISLLSDDESVDAHDIEIRTEDMRDLGAMIEYARIGYLKGLNDCIAQLEERYYYANWFSHLKLLVEVCDLDGIVQAVSELGEFGDTTI